MASGVFEHENELKVKEQWLLVGSQIYVIERQVHVFERYYYIIAFCSVVYMPIVLCGL